MDGFVDRIVGHSCIDPLAYLIVGGVVLLVVVVIAVAVNVQQHNTYGFTPTYDPINNEVGLRYNLKW